MAVKPEAKVARAARASEQARAALLRAVLDAHRAGLSNRQIAAAAGVTHRTVAAMLRADAKGRNQ